MTLKLKNSNRLAVTFYLVIKKIKILQEQKRLKIKFYFG